MTQLFIATGRWEGDSGGVIRSTLMLLSEIGIAIGIFGAVAVQLGFDPPGPGGPGDKASILVSLGLSLICGVVFLGCWAIGKKKGDD